jgi:glycosyltransferase involved in cell wall biosynthesis
MVLNVFKNHRLDIEFTIVGSGALEHILHQLPGNVNHRKNLTDSELQEIYKNSDIFIFPSTLENFGNVVLEALSSGLYVIASDQLRPRFDFAENMNFLEYINPTESGILRAMEKIEEKLKYTGVYSNKLRMHDYIEKTYDWNHVLEQFYSGIIEIYEDK